MGFAICPSLKKKSVPEHNAPYTSCEADIAKQKRGPEMGGEMKMHHKKEKTEKMHREKY